MALYDVKNLKTGETKVLNLSLAKYEEWRENNPDSVSYTHLTLPTTSRV